MIEHGLVLVLGMAIGGLAGWWLKAERIANRTPEQIIEDAKILAANVAAKIKK